MTPRLFLNDAVEISDAGQGRLYVRTPVDEFVILDRAGLIAKVLEAVRTGTSLEATMDCFDDPAVRVEALDGILSLLKTRRVIAPAKADPASPADPIHAWLSHIALKPADAAPACRIWGSGLLYDALRRMLGEVGVACTDDVDAPLSADELIVACLDAPDEAELRRINAKAVDADAPFLPVVLDRHVVSIGPMVLPHATACYECLYHRVRAGRRNLDAFEAATVRRHHPSRLAAQFAAASAATMIVRFLSGSAFDLHTAAVARHNLLTGSSGHTVALKVPRCQVCGQANMRKPLRPIGLSDNRIASLRG